MWLLPPYEHAAIPDDRLRELFIELALSTLACSSTARPGQARGRRGRRARRTPARRSRAALDAINAKRREKRWLAALQRIAAGGTPKRRGRPKKNKGEGVPRQSVVNIASRFQVHGINAEGKVSSSLALLGGRDFDRRDQLCPR